MYPVYEINNRGFRPKIKPYEPGDKWKYAHFKRDGHWTRLEIDTTKPDRIVWNAYTSRPTAIGEKLVYCMSPLLTRIHSGLCGLGVTRGQWVILGELFYPGFPASYVKTGLANCDTNAKFEAFALLKVPNTTHEELANWTLENTADTCAYHGIPFVQFLTNSESFADCSVELLFNKTVCEDNEGFVFKDGNLKNWRKWKPEKTIDLICTGFTDGAGKYTNLIGSIEGSLADGRAVASVSGMDDQVRRDISFDKNACIGRVFECKYQRVESKGRLRHPRFVRWRDDKRPEHCTADQDINLEKFTNG